MEAQGKSVSALDERPVLNDLEHFYYNAFNYLSPMRNSGMGLSAIPLTLYVSFYDVFDAPNDLSFFCEVMREIDGRLINSKAEE